MLGKLGRHPKASDLFGVGGRTWLAGQQIQGAYRIRIDSLLLGFTVFLVGSLACAVNPAMPVLLAGRGIQGLGQGCCPGWASPPSDQPCRGGCGRVATR
ncbi:hypothetical protein [Nonomuraea sp. 10N515B]|uniref:hypothetical protein n=1 Tax=Nonomuraea sp. 10N515B TaxID=3457422 RepID=UPI003FCCEC3E